jgi:hypothetical protein
MYWLTAAFLIGATMKVKFKKSEVQSKLIRLYKPNLFGSGSHEHGSQFQVVAMGKEAQTHSMHHQRFGERERFANETSQTLPLGVIPALEHALSHLFPSPLPCAAPLE